LEIIIVISQEIFFDSIGFFFFPHLQLLGGNQIFLSVIFIFTLIIENYQNKNYLTELKKIQNYFFAYYNNFQSHQNYFRLVKK